MKELVKAALFFLSIALPVTAQVRPSPSPKPSPPPAQNNSQIPTITKIRLDKNQITLPCAEGFKSMWASCPDEPDASIIKVETVTSKPAPAESEFDYQATGGTINGSGAKVEWDISGLQTGDYKLTSTLMIGKNRSNSKTVSISVAECAGCVERCQCAEIKISGPTKSVPAGEILTFNSSVSAGNQEQITYNWTVSEGEIVKGQGTPTIEVQTSPQMAGVKVTATVEIGGMKPSCACTTTSSFEAPALLGGEEARQSSDDDAARSTKSRKR